MTNLRTQYEGLEENDAIPGGEMIMKVADLIAFLAELGDEDVKFQDLEVAFERAEFEREMRQNYEG